MGEQVEAAVFAGIVVGLTLAHLVALFVTGWGHLVADWWRDRFGHG